MWLWTPCGQRLDTAKGLAPYAVLLGTIGIFLLKESLGVARLDIEPELEEPALGQAKNLQGETPLYIRFRVTNSGPAAARGSEVVLGHLKERLPSGVWKLCPFLPSTLQWTNRPEKSRLDTLVPEIDRLVDLAFLRSSEVHFAITPTPLSNYHVYKRDGERTFCFSVTVAAENAKPTTRHFVLTVPAPGDDAPAAILARGLALVRGRDLPLSDRREDI